MDKILYLKNRSKYSPTMTEESYEFAINYKPKNDDIFLVSYPKAGSNWTNFIIKLIVNNGVYEEYGLKGTKSSQIIEICGKNTILKPVIAIELPFDLLPKNPLAKYLYLFRNPKDTVVSQYHYLIERTIFDESVDFHQFFRQWITGQWTDYFAQVSDYWRHRLDGKSDYLVYEQMIRNPKEGILKIANFLGKEFVDKLLANNELLLNEVSYKSSFDFLKIHISLDLKNLLRKGIVGDWRSHLTRDESDLIDVKFTDYFTGTELESIWREDMKWQ